MQAITTREDANRLRATRDRLIEIRARLLPKFRTSINIADEAIERLTEALANWEIRQS